jgi:hypothetical protein
MTFNDLLEDVAFSTAERKWYASLGPLSIEHHSSFISLSLDFLDACVGKGAVDSEVLCVDLDLAFVGGGEL